VFVAKTEGVLRGRTFMPKNSWKKSGHRVDHQQCGQLAARHCEVADTQFERTKLFNRPLINSLVVARNQQQTRLFGKPFHARLPKGFTLRREQHAARCS